MDSMTALVSAFARAYHYRTNSQHVFADPFAQKILTEEEYERIAANMSEGIRYFAPDFKGTAEEAIRFIVDHQLAPSVLARSAFFEQAAEKAIRDGCRQIVIFACGYDTFSLRTSHSDLTVFELDRPEMINDRKQRTASLRTACRTVQTGCDLSGPSWKQELRNAGFLSDEPAAGSLLGISYYLSKDRFEDLLKAIASLWRRDSLICFDYPLAEESAESRKNRELAAAAGEQMKAAYFREETEDLLNRCGFTVCRHPGPEEMTEAFFGEYNSRNTAHPMKAPHGVGYCLAVKNG